MKLTFLGTRGEIEPRTRRHGRHTSAMVSYRRRRVMIDCGRDWLGKWQELRPHAIILTHAHPDHAWGLQYGADCDVYATPETWEDIQNYPIANRHTIHPGRNLTIEGITFRAFTVEHSTHCPAVGYRITAGRARVFYVPDLVYIHDRTGALKGVQLYVGDGATMSRSMVRKQGDRLIGHTPIRTQLTWCRKEGVPRAVITHCGAGIVAGDERKLKPQLRDWADERGLAGADFAHDGMEIVLR